MQSRQVHFRRVESKRMHIKCHWDVCYLSAPITGEVGDDRDITDAELVDGPESTDSDEGQDEAGDRLAEAFPGATTANDNDEPADGEVIPPEEQGFGTPAGGDAPITARDIGIIATKAFPCDDAPKGDKTKQQTLMRYTFSSAVTGGVAHLGDMSQDQLTAVWRGMVDISSGAIEVESTETGMQITTGGKTLLAPRWVEPVADAEPGSGE